MKVLVCGSRTFSNRAAIRRELAKLPPRTIVVHGGAPGADSLGGEVAKSLGFEVRVYKAEWTRYGTVAGPIRNAEMLAKEHPDADGIPVRFVLAFSQLFTREFAPGTSNMISRAERVGLLVVKVSE